MSHWGVVCHHLQAVDGEDGCVYKMILTTKSVIKKNDEDDDNGGDDDTDDDNKIEYIRELKYSKVRETKQQQLL